MLRARRINLVRDEETLCPTLAAMPVRGKKLLISKGALPNDLRALPKIAGRSLAMLFSVGVFRKLSLSDIASLEERQRLARKVHDSVSQALYGVQLGVQTMRELPDDLPPGADAKCALAKRANARSVCHHLRMEIEVGEEPDLRIEANEALYRISQEGMHNIVKHERATRVAIRLRSTADLVELCVSDDGGGFDTGSTFPGHLRLRSMRERTGRSDGTLEITSAPKQRTQIYVGVPRHTT